mmetsp:Transcript_19536/g.24648  ORF Transcript_19536/g.24648 Transcript_19536/m.24648 type:complete len:98 (+) Transcript_19536:152-445(+)
MGVQGQDHKLQVSPTVLRKKVDLLQAVSLLVEWQLAVQRLLVRVQDQVRGRLNQRQGEGPVVETRICTLPKALQLLRSEVKGQQNGAGNHLWAKTQN